MKKSNKHINPKQVVLNPSLTKQHFSTKIFKVYLKCIQHYYPEISVEGICERSGLSYEYIMDETNWASVIFSQKFTAECIEATKDPSLPYISGLSSLTPEGVGSLYFYLTKYTLSTAQIFKTISSQTLNFSKVMSMEIITHGKGFIHIRYRPINLDTLNDDEQKALNENLENIYQNTIGYIASVPTIHGQQKAKVKHYKESGQKGVQELHMQVTYLDTKPVRRMTIWFSSMAVLLTGFGYVWSSQPKEIVLSELTIKYLMTGSLSIFLIFVFLMINYFRQKTITREAEKVISKMDQQYQELQKTEEELRDSEKHYRLLADNIFDVIWMIDLDTLRFLYTSPSIERVTGYTDKEMTGRLLWDVLTPSSMELANREMNNEMAADKTGDAKPRIVELEYFHKDGSTVWTEVSTRFVRDIERHPIAVIGVARDITQRSLLEYRLH